MKQLFSRAGLTFATLLVAAGAFAQSSGSLRGKVKDPSGAVVPGAQVVLANEGTKFSRTVTADARGAYFFAAIDPGSYSLKAEAPGFKSRQIKELRVSPNDALGVDLLLEVGNATDTIVVVADTDIVQTQTGAREGLITAAQIENLSIISRGAMELLRILPGVVAPDINNMQEVSDGGGANATAGYNVNGMRGAGNVITLDGARIVDIGANAGTAVSMNNDFVAEVKVQSSNYAAEYGASGVQVNAISKSGSSEFHGSVYDYYQPYQLSANDRSRNYSGSVRPKTIYNYPGLTLGGPLLLPGTGFNKKRDKAFFFLGLEYQRQKVDPTSGTSFAVVPTANQRQGLFNDPQGLNQSSSPVLIPAGYPGAGTPAPGGDLRPYRNEFGAALLNLIAQPTGAYQDNRYNYAYPAKPVDHNRYQGILRVDFNISESTRAYVRLAQDRQVNMSPKGLWWESSNSELPSMIEGKVLGRTLALNVTSVLSATTTNEFIFSYVKELKDNAVDRNKVGLKALGFSDYHGFFGAGTDLVPGLNFWRIGGGSDALYFGLDTLNMYAYNSSIVFADTVTKVMNTHAVKAGFSFEYSDKIQNFNNNANTTLQFGDRPGTTGNDFADLYVGLLVNVNSGPATPNGHWVRWNWDAFAQDSWQLHKNFTLEFGVRMAKWPSVHAYDNDTGRNLDAGFFPETYDPTQPAFLDAAKTRVNGVLYAEYGQIPNGIIKQPLLVMPRLNFAWDLSGSGKTILRGGAGIFYNRVETNANSGVVSIPPASYNSVSVNVWQEPTLSLATIPTIDPFTISSINAINVTSINKDAKGYPRVFSTSLSLSRRIFWKQTIEAGYVGTFGRHQMSERSLNVNPPGTFLSGTAGNANLSNPLHRAALDGSVVNASKPYAALGNVRTFEFGATSNYHALQATLTRQAGNFNYFIAYTFSKVLGLSGYDNWTVMDPFDTRGRSYSVLDYDRTHILNASWHLKLPNVAKGGLLKHALNDWNISGISNFSSGAPFKIRFSGDLVGDGAVRAWFGTSDYSDSHNAGKIAPVLTCDPRQKASKVGDKILNASCIGVPTFGQSGPFQQPYYFRYPSRMNHDVTVFKNIGLGGAKRLQLRVGLFNVFNQAFPSLGSNDINLELQTTCRVKVDGVPNGVGTADGVCDPTGGYDVNSTNFGKIINKRGHRVIELAAKLSF